MRPERLSQACGGCGPVLEPAGAAACADLPCPRTYSVLTAALVNLVALARSHDTPLVMMSYPSRFKMLYPFANAAIRGAAKRTGVPLIDLTAVFESLCPEEECPELLFEDQHPTERGHRVVAETIATRLPELFPETLREPGSAGGPPEP